MKKFLTNGKSTKEHHPRQRQRTEEEKKNSESDSSRHGQAYFANENMPLGHHNQSYQMEKKSRATQNIQNCDYKKNRYSTNPTSEKLHLNEAYNGTKHSGTTDNYKKFHNAPISNQNKRTTYFHARNPTIKEDLHKTTDTRIKFEKKLTPVINDFKDECLNIQSNKISANEESPSINNTQFRDESSTLLQNYSTPAYASNLLLQHYNKQNNDQSNEYFYDLSKNNVYTHQERANGQIYHNITYNSSLKTDFLNNSSLYESIGFSTFKLKDLLYYNVNLMQDQQLFKYASAVKCKILEKIDLFHQPERDELEFLCEITDGDQSEKNQRLITTRACHIVRNITEKFPLLLNAEETPHSSQIVYKTAPNLHYTTNSYCCNYESPVLEPEMAQNSVMLYTSAEDYNLKSEYDIAQNSTCVHLKSNSDSFDIKCLNRENCEVQNWNTNSAKNDSPINSLITGKNKDMTFSEHSCRPAVNPEEYTPAEKFSFNEENSTFIVFGLDNLLKYDVNAMHGDLVFDYAFSMKQRILEKIHQLKDPYKEKLEFLCELTDGTQREQNQKLINEQMCYLITFAYKNKSVPDKNRNFSGEQSRNSDPRRSRNLDARRR